jgi:hypothetical protein
MEPKHPDITVELIGTDGNAFSVLGKVKQAMKRAGVDPAEISDFFEEARAGDYDHLLATRS